MVDKQEKQYNDRSEQCGLGSWRPKWLQRLANPNSYTFVYGALAVTHGILGAYLNSVTTTVEKRFGLSSSMSGIWNATNDISSILFSLIITYFGSRGSRPLWMGAGVLLMGISVMIIASAELVPIDESDLLTGSDLVQRNLQICRPFANDTRASNNECKENTSLVSSSTWAAILLFTGQFLYGLGKGGFYSLGVTYLDDSIKHDKLPLYLGLTWIFRLIGPSVGYLLGSAALKLYRKPNATPGYGNRDPRWIGAWWIGFVIVGIAELFFGFFMMLFPRQMSVKTHKSNTNNGSSVEKADAEIIIYKPSLRDFWNSVKRVAKNPILVTQCLSHSLHLFSIIGFIAFLPKYLESQFRITASQASLFTGVAGLSVMILGIGLCGVTLWKLCPRTLFVTGWAVVAHAAALICIVIQMTLHCPDPNFANIRLVDGRPESTNVCSSSCDCEGLKPSPVCVNDKNFLSPCFAGCTMSNTSLDGKMSFWDCSCAINDQELMEGFLPSATSGYCSSSCTMFIAYVALLATSKFISSTSIVGGTLITMRAVSLHDKSVAMGIMGTVTDLIAFIPAPIAFGAAVDSACDMWNEKCGQRTNCWLYNGDKFRYVLHGLPIACLSLKLIFEVFTCYFSRNLMLYDDPKAISQLELTSKADSNKESSIK